MYQSFGNSIAITYEVEIWLNAASAEGFNNTERKKA